MNCSSESVETRAYAAALRFLPVSVVCYANIGLIAGIVVMVFLVAIHYASFVLLLSFHLSSSQNVKDFATCGFQLHHSGGQF